MTTQIKSFAAQDMTTKDIDTAERACNEFMKTVRVLSVQIVALGGTYRYPMYVVAYEVEPGYRENAHP